MTSLLEAMEVILPLDALKSDSIKVI